MNRIRSKINATIHGSNCKLKMLKIIFSSAENKKWKIQLYINKSFLFNTFSQGVSLVNIYDYRNVNRYIQVKIKKFFGNRY